MSSNKYLVARLADGQVAGVRVTGRRYTHAVVTTSADGRSVVVSWHSSPALAMRARDQWGVLAFVREVTEGTRADLVAWRPTFQQVVEYAPGAVMRRRSVLALTEVAVLDLVDLGGIEEHVAIPEWWEAYPSDSFLGRGRTPEQQMVEFMDSQRCSRRCRREGALANGHRNADGSLTLWMGWSTSSARWDSQMVVEYALAGMACVVRKVAVTSTVVG